MSHRLEQIPWVNDISKRIIWLGDFSAKLGREDILNRQLGMKVYTKLIIMLGLE
jgi:hypothetical protein